MKWVLIIGLLLVVIVGFVAIMGALLPRDHVATLSARIAGTPDAVWNAMNEQARTSDIPVVVEVSEPPHRLVTRISDENLPFGGSWEFQVDPDGANASRVTITERGSVYNPLFRFVSRYIMGHTATIKGFLKTLDTKFAAAST